MRQSLPVRMPLLASWGLLLILAILMAGFQLGEFRTLGSHETLAAVPAREMQRSGDWVVPRYATIPRLQKPPLVYWLIATSGWLTATFDDFTVRLHSAAATLALMGIMSLWAARWYGREAAFGAGLIQVSSLWVLNFGRRAEVDMVLCLLIAATMFLIAEHPEDEARPRCRRRWLVIETLLGLSWLAKFHYGIAMVLGPTFVFWMMQRRWRRFRDLFNPMGMLVVLACVVVWPWLVSRQLPDALWIWRSETVGRAVGELGHDRWWFYLPALFGMTLPWTGNLFLAAPASWLRAWRAGDERERFLWTWLLVDLAIVSCQPNKHENYLLASLPPCTLLASQAFARIVAKAHRGTVPLPTFVLFVGAVGAIALGAVMYFLLAPQWPVAEAHVRLTAICLASGLLVACFWLWRRQAPLAGWTTILSLMVSYLLVVSSVFPARDYRAPAAEFARHLRRDVLRDEEAWIYDLHGGPGGMHPIAYYLGDPVRRAESSDELLQQLRVHGELTVVIEQRRLPCVEQLAEIDVIRRMPASQDRDPGSSLICVRLRPLEVGAASVSQR